MFRSALLILSGNAFASLMMLVRNLLVARLISVEDYGIAATFAISMAIVEMMSTLGLQQLIVQDTKGNDPKLQSGLQGFHLMRSVFSAAVLFFLAHPIAQFLGIPEIAWAYQVLALVPLLNGLTHFDIYRRQRQMVYLPSILSTTLPAVLSVLLVWPLYEYFGDFRVMLYAVMVQAIGTVVFSQITASRRYSLSFDRSIILRSLNFGWPLLVNNILLFAVFQGEKLIVGREMGMEALAIFAMGFTLTMTPTLVIARSTQSFFLPQLSAAKDDPERFQHLAMATMQTSLVNGLFVLAGMVLLGAPIVHFLLGAKFDALIPFLIWLSILQAARIFKTGSSTVALSQGRTSNAMISNMFRAASLIPSWYVAASGGELLTIIWIATLAELCGFAAAVGLVGTRVGVKLGKMAAPIGVSLALLAAAAALALWGGSALSYQLVAATLALLLISMVLMRDLRLYIRQRVLTKYSE